ncbi:MAG TPA: hypothetical protein VL132_17990 [Planctomycetaceae bacterium]|nr:hypothetical protein [Planctomycetaceae bacterium]
MSDETLCGQLVGSFESYLRAALEIGESELAVEYAVALVQFLAVSEAVALEAGDELQLAVRFRWKLKSIIAAFRRAASESSPSFASTRAASSSKLLGGESPAIS